MEMPVSKTKRNLILMNACLTTFMATLDSSIVNIVMPVISKHFSVNIDTVQWIVTSYLLTISAILLIWGRIADIYGTKKLFMAGIAIFTLGSLFCGLSGNFTLLVLSRVLQAVGASITMALTQGIVTSVFPANERGKALGFIGTVVSIGSLLGPGLGGILVHYAGWQFIFFINVPIGIIGVFLTIFIMSETKAKEDYEPFDVKGSVIFIFTILMVFISLLSMQQGIISISVMALIALISAVLLIIFIRYEIRTEYPLIHMELFKNSTFSIGLAASFLSFIALFSYTFFMPFYLQYVLKYSVLKSGLLMSLYPITAAIISPFSGRLSDRITYRPLTITGLGINTAIMFMMAFLDASATDLQLIPLFILLGAGSSIFQSPNNSSIMGSVPKNKLGIAGSINAFFRNLGMVSGATFSVILFTFATKINIKDLSKKSFDTMIFLNGFRIVLLCASGLIFCAVLLSIYRAGKKQNPSL